MKKSYLSSTNAPLVSVSTFSLLSFIYLPSLGLPSGHLFYIFISDTFQGSLLLPVPNLCIILYP